VFVLENGSRAWPDCHTAEKKCHSCLSRSSRHNIGKPNKHQHVWLVSLLGHIIKQSETRLLESSAQATMRSKNESGSYQGVAFLYYQ